MAYLDATEWNDLQITEGSNEKRYTPLGLLDATKDSGMSQDYIPPSAIESLRTMSSLRNLQIPVLKDQSVTVVTTPGYTNIPSNLGESAQYAYTAYDVFSGFRYYPAQAANNSMDGDFYKRNIMLNVAHACGSQIETILAARYEDRKSQLLGFTTQVSQGDGTYTFNGTSDTLEINKAAQKDTMFYNLENLMAANDLGGSYRIVTSRAGLSEALAQFNKFGAANSENKQALGFLPQDRIYETNTVAAGSDIFNGWFVRDGAMGMIENHPYNFAQDIEFAGKKWTVSDMELPFARMRANIYTNNQATEATSIVSGNDSNMIMTHFEEMAIWFRFYVFYRYNSDLTTRAQDVVKLQGLTT